LMLQASVMGMACRLNSAEIWASMTTRAAKALGMDHLVGKIDIGYQADLLVYDCEQWQDILYQQGQLKPKMVICRGQY
jgi:imidazolonepropionase